MDRGLEMQVCNPAPVRLDFSLTVQRGKTVALVGPSGAGKTSILRCLAGLMKPRSGQIRCNGQQWLDSDGNLHLPAQARRAGFVFQSYALFPHLTALRNVMESMLELPLPQRREKALHLLADVQLDGLESRRPAQLSGGQQQRVALARALARDPDVLLLDEPFSAVDHPTRRALHRLLTDLRRQTDIPIILVSHDVRDAGEAADEICLVLDGRNVEQGPSKTLLENPHSRLSVWLNGD